jgi:aminobenzoyl-glutamate utilization protein B
LQTKQDVIAWLDEHQSRFTEMADQIWANPELAWEEFKSSKLQADLLEAEGFEITWDVGGISTAFVAEWGQGRPTLGFAGEYDALPGLSQTTQPSPQAVVEDGPGHGCGHNLLGTGCLAAAVAVAKWLEATSQTGTIRYYGCPAEERGGGKVFMARAGAFDDLDAAFNYHPGQVTFACKGSAVAVNQLKFRFYGRAAHAGAFPHLGRSALDGVELMNVGVNYLREHVLDSVRIHYVITDGGQAPNIVPETAEVWYFVRAPKPHELAEVTERVRKIAQGAAMMTETQLEERFTGGLSSLLSNHTLADLQYEVMTFLGPIQFTDEERTFAQAINDQFPPGTKEQILERIHVPDDAVIGSLSGDIFSSLDEGHTASGSTDVGDLSWKTPLSMLRTACFPTGAPGHSWGIVAASGTSIGHKGMMYAAKVMALAAIDLIVDPDRLAAAQKEFEAQVAKTPYACPMPDDLQPPLHEHPYR